MKKNKREVCYVWGDLEDDVNRLVTQMLETADLKQIKNIYGIPRGGLVAAVMLSHRLEKPLITDRKMITSKTLIVDDLTDSGNTLSKFRKNQTAVLLHNKKSKYVPTYYGSIKPTGWIVFPFEF